MATGFITNGTFINDNKSNVTVDNRIDIAPYGRNFRGDEQT